MKKLMVMTAALAALSLFADEPAAPAAAPAAPSKPAALRPAPGRPGPGAARRMGPRGPMGRNHGFGMMRGRPFGKLSDGREAQVWRLVGAGGLTLDVTDYGGRLVRCYAPDRFGNLADVTLGFNTAAEYEKNGFSMGTLIGRVGNRIADGKFTLDGQEYKLAVNEKTATRNCNLHGGPQGWDSKIWSVRPVRAGLIQGIELTYVSEDGEMGFPGRVTCKVRYTVHPNNVWTVDYEATTDKTTVINPTHHSYWNLAGEASGNVLAQELQIFADEYTETTAGLIPTKNVPVKGTGFDFSEMRPIGAKADWMAKTEHLKAMDNWYDHNFVLKGGTNGLHQAATMRDPVSGRRLEVWTTEPGMQMYGAQNMDKAKGMKGKAAGCVYDKFQGVALETQHFPDSPNRLDFPSVVLRPGETFRSRTEYRFFAE